MTKYMGGCGLGYKQHYAILFIFLIKVKGTFLSHHEAWELNSLTRDHICTPYIRKIS